MEGRIYVDNAATSWPKPRQVVDAVNHYLLNCGAPAGRSAYAEATESDQRISDTRRRLAQRIGVSDARCIAFTANGTDALNLALFGLLRKGDRVITSVAEHNSVLRPLTFLEQSRGVEVVRCGCDSGGRMDVDQFREALRLPTRLVAMTHASNVTGVVQPIAEIAQLAHQQQALVLVDAAQTIGHIPISVAELGADLLAAPAHKGLLAPSGLGFLYAHPDLHDSWQLTRCGGTGTQSDEDRQPMTMPAMLEVGSPNLVSIFGLAGAIDYFEQDLEISQLAQQEHHWGEELHQRISDIDQVSWVSPWHDDNLAVVSFQVQGYGPQEFAAMLDAIGRVQVRAGFHCAPRMHGHLGTAHSGGTIRLSGGPFNTRDEIDAIVQTIGIAASV
jgi:cysteine desulfurase/selenocysteine lyase